jgi:hypothetical protein
MLYQVTETRLRELDASWSATLQRFRGPVPRSLGLCHMLAETNGNPEPVTHDPTRRTVGIMRLTLLDTTRLGYQEAAALDPRTNVYLWCKLANQNAETLHRLFSTWWTNANLDFWLAVRLFFIVGPAVITNLFNTVARANRNYHSTVAVLNWIRTEMPAATRFGAYNRFQLLQVATHLDQVLAGMCALDGPRYTAAHFSIRVPAPNNDEALFANTIGYTTRTELSA